MHRRRYRIECSAETLALFVNIVAANQDSAMIERVTTSSSEEYFYVVAYVDRRVEQVLTDNRFTDSMYYAKGG